MSTCNRLDLQTLGSQPVKGEFLSTPYLNELKKTRKLTSKYLRKIYFQSLEFLNQHYIIKE